MCTRTNARMHAHRCQSFGYCLLGIEYTTCTLHEASTGSGCCQRKLNTGLHTEAASCMSGISCWLASSSDPSQIPSHCTTNTHQLQLVPPSCLRMYIHALTSHAGSVQPASPSFRLQSTETSAVALTVTVHCYHTLPPVCMSSLLARSPYSATQCTVYLWYTHTRTHARTHAHTHTLHTLQCMHVTSLNVNVHTGPPSTL